MCDVAVQNLSGVQLDCRNHMIGHVMLTNVTDSTISNCRAVGIGLLSAQRVIISANTTNGTSPLGSAGIFVRNGGSNQILQNTIDGGWDGVPGSQVGGDDGILVYDETGDVIQNNTIRNVWDAGIEGVSGVANSTISGNAIVGAAIAGIGAYRNTAWRSNIVTGNNVSRANHLFLFENVAVGGATFGFVFRGNQFLNNRLSSRVQAPGQLTNQAVFAFDSSVDVDSNLIQANDFGTSGTSPLFVPSSGFVDGGGNTCTTGATQPITCH
jgi:hypothetical protein